MTENTDSMITSEYVVASIDILGAKKYIFQSENEYLNIVHDVYTRTFEANHFFAQIYSDKIEIKIFSDNILLACPTMNDLFSAFWYICEFSVALQGEFLEKNILLRGGISFGTFHIDQTMCWGKALVKAYELESKIAIYPRIIVDPEFYKLFNPEKHECHKSLVSDTDDITYLDYLIYGHGNPQILEKLDMFITHIEEEINDDSNELKAKQKFAWHKNYLLYKKNSLAQKNAEKKSTGVYHNSL